MYLQNKYTTWYYSNINHAISRTLQGYTEKHHIIPKSLGGTNCLSNLVILTAREHYICHLLLTKMTIGDARFKMSYALMMMSIGNRYNQRYNLNNRQYEYARNLLSSLKTGRKNGPSPMRGRSRPIISDALKGRKQSEEHIFNSVNARRISQQGKCSPLKNRKWWNNGTTTKMAVECPGPDWILGRRLILPS